MLQSKSRKHVVEPNPWIRSQPTPWSVPREWEGETAVILGGGPSLKPADIRLAAARGWKRIACNDSIKLCYDSEVVCWSDSRWYYWNNGSLILHRGRYRITWQQALVHPALSIKALSKTSRPFSVDPAMVAGNNTGLSALNLAFLFGAQRIVLLGFDMRRIDGRDNWHKNNRQVVENGDHYSKLFLPAFESAAPYLRKRGIDVINATPGSALTVFPIEEMSCL